MWNTTSILQTGRNTQLDGWRAFAVAGVMWLHWTPASWRGGLPFEIGLFYFLTLTGFLITRILLRQRIVGEAEQKPWRRAAMADFMKRRFARILIPCCAAMIFAIAVGAPDIRSHPAAYFLHVSNWHIAFMPGWPSGTSHYWTLAIQMQFYLIWPVVVFLTPRRTLGWVFGLAMLVAPVSRWVVARYFPEIHHVEAVTGAAMDYFGAGALLALAIGRGMRPGDRRLRGVALSAFAGYAVLYVCNELGKQVPVACYIQQTLLAIAFAGLISSTLAGFWGLPGRVLDHPAVQHVAKLSYGLYLLHTAVPLLVGLVIPWLWLPGREESLLPLRLPVFALFSWGASWLCWRWLEGPNRLSWSRLLPPAGEHDRSSGL